MPKPVAKLPAVVSAVAAVVVLLVCIYMEMELYEMAWWVSVTVVVFAVLGIVLRLFLISQGLFPSEEEVEESLYAPKAETNLLGEGISGMIDVNAEFEEGEEDEEGDEENENDEPIAADGEPVDDVFLDR